MSLVTQNSVLALAIATVACSQAIPPSTTQCDSQSVPTASTTTSDRELRLILRQVQFAELPGWRLDELGAAIVALRRSCAVLAKLDDDKQLGGQIDTHAGDWRSICARAATIDPANHDAARTMFEDETIPYAVASAEGATGRFTGYYEPWMRGSMKPRGKYQTPLYRKPSDLVTVNLAELSRFLKGRLVGRVVNGALKPYFTRGEIMDGALRGHELLWVDDPIDAFFTQVQGSGRVRLDTGEQLRVAYAGKNGRAYTAIGRVLIQEGHLTSETVSMQSIRAYLRENPSRQEEIFRRNEGFVFFRINRGDGPYGSQGVVLTPGRSIAIDIDFIPHTVPVFVDTLGPVAGEDREQPFQHLLIAQDTGGAIRGPIRGDIYYGGDEAAADKAGRMKGVGRYFVLLPKHRCCVNPENRASSAGINQR